MVWPGSHIGCSLECVLVSSRSHDTHAARFALSHVRYRLGRSHVFDGPAAEVGHVIGAVLGQRLEVLHGRRAIAGGDSQHRMALLRMRDVAVQAQHVFSKVHHEPLDPGEDAPVMRAKEELRQYARSAEGVPRLLRLLCRIEDGVQALPLQRLRCGCGLLGCDMSHLGPPPHVPLYEQWTAPPV